METVTDYRLPARGLMLAGGRRVCYDVEENRVKKDLFRVDYWKTRISEARRLVEQNYPPGCLDWLMECDPGRVEELKATVGVAKAAYLEGDQKALGRALTAYLKAHFQTFEKFRRNTGNDE
jgi:hypothetical protein